MSLATLANSQILALKMIHVKENVSCLLQVHCSVKFLTYYYYVNLFKIATAAV